MLEPLTPKNIRWDFAFLFNKYGFAVTEYDYHKESFSGCGILVLENGRLQLTFSKDRGQYMLDIRRLGGTGQESVGFNRLYRHLQSLEAYRPPFLERLARIFQPSRKKEIRSVSLNSLGEYAAILKANMDLVLELFDDEHCEAFMKTVNAARCTDLVNRFGLKTADQIMDSSDRQRKLKEQIPDLDVRIVKKIREGRKLSGELIEEIIREHQAEQQDGQQ